MPSRPVGELRDELFTSKESDKDPDPKNQKRAWKGVWIDRDLYLRDDLSWTEKILFIEIHYLSENGDYGCCAGNEYFASFLNLSAVQTSRCINHLKDLGLIEQTAFDGRRRYLKSILSQIATRHKGSGRVVINDDADSSKMTTRIKDKSKEIRDKEGNASKEASAGETSRRGSSSSSKDHILPKTGPWAVVTAWNDISKIEYAKHIYHHTDMSTKIIKRVAEYISQLENGTFGDDLVWSVDWIKNAGIDMARIKRRWSIREICDVIRGPMTDKYRPEYRSEYCTDDKKDISAKRNLPKALDVMFYNRETGQSEFIYVITHPPKRKAEEVVKDVIAEDPYPAVTKFLTRRGVIDPKTMRPHEFKDYFEGVQGLQSMLKKIDWNSYGARQMFPFGDKGVPLSLIGGYYTWLIGKNPDLIPPSSISDRLHQGMFRKDYWGWQKFMEAVNRYWGLVFNGVRYEEG